MLAGAREQEPEALSRLSVVTGRWMLALRFPDS